MKETFTHSHLETTKAVRRLKEITAQKLKGGECYRLDRSSLDSYLADFPEWKRRLYRYFEELREKGERVVFVDVCGRALAPRHTDRNYSFSLQPLRQFARPEESRGNIVGDIFSARDFYSFVRMIRENGDQPTLVTFLPVAGLQDYTPLFEKDYSSYRAVVEQRLENNLRKIAELLRPGGFMLIDQWFQLGDSIRDFISNKPKEEWASARQIKTLAAQLDFSVEIAETLGGLTFLLRKRLPRGRKRASRP